MKMQPWGVILIKSEILRNALSTPLDKMASVTTDPHTRCVQSTKAASLICSDSYMLTGNASAVGFCTQLRLSKNQGRNPSTTLVYTMRSPVCATNTQNIEFRNKPQSRI